MDIFSQPCSSVIKTKRVGYFKNTFGGAKWAPDTQKGVKNYFCSFYTFHTIFLPWGFEHDPQTDLGITWAIASGYIPEQLCQVIPKSDK